MNDRNPRISVLIITYNQESLIKRAINSLLAQKDYIYEICVSDDQSSDQTWNVLQEYSDKNPGLFVLNRNNPNLGIFENIEKTWSMPSGDIIYQLAGDDECGEGWFKSVVDYIQKNNIDYLHELFCIYGDYKCIYSSGLEVIHRNDEVDTNKNLFSLSLRGIIGNRSACYSVKILKKFFKVSDGRSHIAESAQDRQLQLFCEKSYYIPVVGNIYYSGIGESTSILRDEIFYERKAINYFMIEKFADYGYVPSKSDYRYIKYNDAFLDFHHTKSFKNTIRLVYRWVLSFDPSIGIKSLDIDFLLSHIKKMF